MRNFFDTIRGRAYRQEPPAARHFLVTAIVSPRDGAEIPHGYYPGELVVSVRGIHHHARPLSYHMVFGRRWRRRGLWFRREPWVTRHLIATSVVVLVQADQPEEITVKVTGDIREFSKLEYGIEESV